MIDLTARQQGYYAVYVEGARFSQHIAEREAVQRSAEVLASDPTLAVEYRHEYAVDVVPSDAVAEVTPPDTSPTSDGGEDLIDFLDRIQREPTEINVIEAPDFATALRAFADQTKTGWLIRRLYMTVDGHRAWVGIGWRGYILLWLWRDRQAIRIGSGS